LNSLIILILLLPELYSQIKIGTGTSDTAAFKSDATFFTIADGIVQHMFIEYLFAGNKFFDIVGEEDDSVVNIKDTPFTVDDLTVPEEFEELINNTLEKVKALADRIDPTAYSAYTIFVDPIDGTREFATGKGDKVTILVGYNDADGVPQAGIVYRPLTFPATWASGAKTEGYTAGVLDLPDEPNPKGVLITDGKVSPFIKSTIENSGMNMVPSLASGNRVLMLVEGKAGAYIRDTGGFAKWDTSGPQAVLEAYGGVMAKLPAFLEDKTMESYTHKKSTLNLDFCKRSVGLTLSNARDKSMYIPGLDSIVTDVHLVKEYSCVQGLVALAPTKMEAFYMNAIHSAMNNIKKDSPPFYT
jgi:3'-phosphoadenosine 5'-phosphosulfate (PAPS) 3'-phosphatase